MERKRRILLMEDDYASMCDTKEFLEELGHEVELTASATILNRLAREKFDLIIVDIMIQPKSINGKEQIDNVHYDNVNWSLTGTEFAMRLRRGDYTSDSPEATPPDVPVIILSAVAGPPVPNTLPNLFRMEKPFRLSQLAEKIKEIVRE